MNALRVIHPYKDQGMWVFDDAHAELVKEPFVSGADEMIERMTADIPDAENGFHLIFSDAPFPGYQLEVERQEEEFGGTWYYSHLLRMKGWLCPALLKYFERPPMKLYAQFTPNIKEEK
jgi:hypothetical protein